MQHRHRKSRRRSLRAATPDAHPQPMRQACILHYRQRSGQGGVPRYCFLNGLIYRDQLVLWTCSGSARRGRCVRGSRCTALPGAICRCTGRRRSRVITGFGLPRGTRVRGTRRSRRGPSRRRRGFGWRRGSWLGHVNWRTATAVRLWNPRCHGRRGSGPPSNTRPDRIRVSASSPGR